MLLTLSLLLAVSLSDVSRILYTNGLIVSKRINFRRDSYYKTFDLSENVDLKSQGDKTLILEIFTKKTYFSDETSRDKMLNQIISETDEASPDFIAYNSLYKKDKEDKMSVVLDSPVMKVVDLIFNPIALVFTLYFSILGYNKFSGFFSFITSLLTGKKKSPEEKVVKFEELPYQVFECEVCEMQMRPAKGRAEKIFGRERFRCSRCGAKASAYFNIDDLSDPRAVERLERIAREKEEEDSLGDDVDPASNA